MENSEESSENNLRCIHSRISEEEIDSDVYKRIAKLFTHPLSNISNEMKIEILKKYVRFGGEPIYVNEMRNILLYNDAELFKEYGMKFLRNKGCFEVFGIVPVDPIDNTQSDDKYLSDLSDDKNCNRASNNRDKHKKKKVRVINRIKKDAKELACEKYAQRAEMREEKKKKRREFERLVKKENSMQ